MVMGLCAGAMAQSEVQSVVNTAALKGTVDVTVNVWNNGNDTNCDAWLSNPVKLDAWLVICFGEVFCPQCPIDVIDAYFVLVDKKRKEVWVEGWESYADLDMYCLGGWGILMALGIEYLDNDPDIIMVAKRKDTLVSNSFFLTTTKIMSAKGAFGEEDVNVLDQYYPIPCEEESLAVAGTATFSDFKLKVPKNSCLTCGSSCSDYTDAFFKMLLKKYPESKYEWIDAENESFWDWHYGYLLE
jgi:hypothetical protein